MSRWFRFYTDVMRNPKVARLSDKDFRLWTEMLSIAAENDGAIPDLEALKHLLKRRLDHLSTAVDRLISGGLIDRLEGGYEPHNWSKFQYKSDTSTDRVHKHRQKRNVSETPPETETETETEEKKEGGASFGFFGRTIRLNDRDLAEWRRVYSAIPDITAELTAIDAWWQGQDDTKPKNWFYRTSSMLNRKHQDFLKNAESDPMENFIV